MNGSNIYEVKYNGDEISMIKYNGSILWENYITLIDYETFEADGINDYLIPVMPWFGDNITLDNIIIEEEVLAENVAYKTRYPEVTDSNGDRVGTFYRRKIKSKEEPNGFAAAAARNHETNTAVNLTAMTLIEKIYDLCDLRDVTSCRLNYYDNTRSHHNFTLDFFSDKTFRYIQNCSGVLSSPMLTDSDLEKLTGFMSKIDGRIECDCSSMFGTCENLTKIVNIPWNKITATNGIMMFHMCKSLTTLDLSDLRTKNNMDTFYMFCGCTNLKTLDIRNIDISNSDQTFLMFDGCTSLTTLRLDNCNNATINKIITSSSFPTFSSGTHRIYCKEANASGLTAPEGWTFTYVS